MKKADCIAFSFALLASLASCQGADGLSRPAGPDGTWGALQAALVVPPGFGDLCPGVEGLRVEVFDAEGALVESADTHLKDQSFPSAMFPGLQSADGVPLDELGTGHGFGDAYFVLLPGRYRVRAVATDAEGEIHPSCRSAETEVVVHAGLTSEVFLIVQCDCATGGLDVVVALNCAPIIWRLHYDPNKFVCCFEDLLVTVFAEDPEGDAFTWSWELVSPLPAPETLRWQASEGALSFYGPPGSYEFRVTVTDTTGAASSLVFPIHVMGETSGCEACEAPPDCVAAESWDWRCEEAEWSANVQCVDGALTMDEAWDCAGSERLWAPSTGDDRLTLFDLPTGALRGDFALPAGCAPSAVARDEFGSAFVACGESGLVLRVSQSGEILRQVDLGAAPWGCTAMGGLAFLPRTRTLYAACAARGEGPGMVLALNGTSLTPAGPNGGVAAEGVGGFGLATDGELVFAADGAGLVAIAPQTNAPVWTLPVQAQAIVAREGWLWFADAEARLCRVAATTAAPGAPECLAYEVPSAHEPGARASRGQGLAVNPRDGSVWLALGDADAVLEFATEPFALVAILPTGVTDPVAVGFAAGGDVVVIHGGRDHGAGGVATARDGVVRFDFDAGSGGYGGPVLFGRSALEGPVLFSSDPTGSAQCFPRSGYWKQLYALGCPGACKQVVVEWEAAHYVEVKTFIDGEGALVYDGRPFETHGDLMEIRLRLTPDHAGAAPTVFDLSVRYQSPCP